MRLLGKLAGLLGLLARYYTGRGRYLLAVRLYGLGTWLYHQDTRLMQELIRRLEEV